MNTELLINDQYDILLKLVLVGDSSVGKTSCLMQKIDNKFNEQGKTTIGIDFRIETVKCKDKIVKVQYWDTAGCEKFRGLTSAYYRGSSGILLMFDVTNERSFSNIKTWIEDIKKSVENVPILLVGNKCDNVHMRIVHYEDCIKLSKELGLNYMDMSVKENKGVHEAFYKLTELSVEGNNYLNGVGKLSKNSPTLQPFNLNENSGRLNKRRDNKCCK
ncbi:hypothetical protein ABK040_001189 [Willaertia magna]